MYTEVLIKAIIKDECLEEIEDFVIKERDIGDTYYIRFGCSYYHFPKVIIEFEDGYLFMRFDIKNYHGQIEEFLDWLVPKLEIESDQCIGWFWYEEEELPTLLWADSKGDWKKL